MTWIKRHKVLFIILVLVVVIIALLFGVRGYNLSKKNQSSPSKGAVSCQAVTEEPTAQTKTPAIATEVPTDSTEEPVSNYESSLSLRVEQQKKLPSLVDSGVDEEFEAQDIPSGTPEPVVDVNCKIFGKTVVPKKNVDGSSCREYLSSVTINDFGSNWGTGLTDKDIHSTVKYLVGVNQDGIEEEIADLQSVGWLISNIKSLGKHDVIKFTNLHVIGRLSDSHVALLCSYDWYSVFGLKDTLVFFEDISNTLEVADFKKGSIFSATAFVHNIVIKEVNKQNVVCVEYVVAE